MGAGTLSCTWMAWRTSSLMLGWKPLFVYAQPAGFDPRSFLAAAYGDSGNRTPSYATLLSTWGAAAVPSTPRAACALRLVSPHMPSITLATKSTQAKLE